MGLEILPGWAMVAVMKWCMVAVGKPALAYARAGVEDYLARIRRYTDAEMIWVKEGASVAETGRRVLEHTKGCRAVLLDETGQNMNTRELQAAISGLERDGVKKIAILIGGADGHAPEVKAAVRDRWALGKLTLQHELAMVVWLEQLYRQLTLGKGEPYHRD